MKKIASGIVSFILVFALFCFPASAAGTGTLALSGAEGKQGDTVTVNVNLNANPGLISMRFAISWEEGLELTSVSNTGVLAGWTAPSSTISSPYTLRWADSLATTDSTKTGKIATLSFKIKDNAAVGNKSVTLTFTESRDAVGNKNSFSGGSATVKVNCKTHAYGAYTNKDGSNHTRTCSVCANVETKAHTWNSGTVTKAASCKETGIKTYTCTACGATKTETVAKTTAHKYSNWETTKEATCTAKGEQARVCSVCEKKETKAIDALGHNFTNPTVTKEPTCTQAGEKTGKCKRCGQTAKETIKPTGHTFGDWTDETPATCTEGGKQKRVCEVCQAEEKRDTEALGHDFENPVVVREATIYSTGLMQGKCKRCGETTDQIIPCTYTDETNGVTFEAEEGVFREGTRILVEPVPETGENYENAKSALAEVASEWVIYDISALLDGVKTQPNGKMKVSFTIPNGYGRNVAIYYISDDNACEMLGGEVSDDGKTVSAELEHLSLYAVCKLGTENTAVAKDAGDAAVAGESNTDKENGNVKAFLILAGVLVVVLILAAIGAAIWLVKSGKRKRYRF